MTQQGLLMNENTHWSKQRENIFSVAQQLFWEKGYDGTSIADIAEKAMVNKATIYYYFENKTTIMYEIAIRALDTLINMAQPIMNSGLTPEKKLKKMLDNEILWSLEHPMNAFSAILERRNLPEKQLKVVVEKRDYYESFFRELLAELIPENNAKIIDGRIATFFVFGLMHSLSLWYKKDGELTVEEIASKVRVFISEALNIPELK